MKNNRRIFEPCLRTKKKRSVDYGGDVNIICSWSTWNGCQKPGKKTSGIGNQNIIV